MLGRFFGMPSWKLMDKEGDEDRGGAGGGSVDPEQFKQMVDTVNTLSAGVGQLMESVKHIGGSISELAKGRSKDDEDEDEDADVSFDDLESMSRADFAKHLGGIFGKEIDKRLKSVDEKIDGINKSVGTIDAKATFNELAKQHKDFKDWIPEMREQVEAKPGLTLEDAYDLVKAKNPKKVKELEEKYTEKKPDDEKGKASFGGLTPTSGRTAKSKDMTKEDAQESAWQETMSALDEASLGSGD